MRSELGACVFGKCNLPRPMPPCNRLFTLSFSTETPHSHEEALKADKGSRFQSCKDPKATCKAHYLARGIGGWAVEDETMIYQGLCALPCSNEACSSWWLLAVMDFHCAAYQNTNAQSGVRGVRLASEYAVVIAHASSPRTNCPCR